METVSKEQVEEFLRPWTEAELFNGLNLLVAGFIHERNAAEQRVRELSQQFPITYLATSSIIDHTGRETAQVGSVDQDKDGQVVRNISQMMEFVAHLLRLVIDRLIQARGLDAERTIEFLSRSPAFDPKQRLVLESGIRAYFSQDWIVAIHVLVPQIENTVRRIVVTSGGSGVKKGRDGAMTLKTLDDLLRDELFVQTVGNDLAGYFRILLTDQRGWNVRNEVCHGLMPAGKYNPKVADRLLHALLCLGRLEARTRQDEPTPRV